MRYGKIIHERKRVDYRSYGRTNHTLTSLLHLYASASCALRDNVCAIFFFTTVLSFVHSIMLINSQLTEYAGLSPTCSRILNGQSRVVGHSIHLYFHKYMPNNGYIIYVALLQLLIYLLFSYTTCEWSESEFHTKVLLCSVLSSERGTSSYSTSIPERSPLI